MCKMTEGLCVWFPGVNVFIATSTHLVLILFSLELFLHTTGLSCSTETAEISVYKQRFVSLTDWLYLVVEYLLVQSTLAHPNSLVPIAVTNCSD